MVRSLAALLATLVSASVVPAQPGRAPPASDEVTAEIVIEQAAPEIFVQEALTVTIRVVLRRPVASLDVTVPAIPNARTVTLVTARWLGNVDGLGGRAFERTLVLFPQRGGTLEIPSVPVRATLTEPTGRRYEVETQTPAQTIEVRPLPDEARAGWWLPARSVAISDGWDPSPDRLQQGEATRRTVVVEAAGVLAEQLPPLPPLRTPGVVTFANPVRLETVTRSEGLLARATYQWDVRLGVPHPVVLQALTVPWFDTQARRMRDAVVPARRLAAGDAALPPLDPEPSGLSRLGPVFAAVSAFGLGIAWVAALFGAGRGHRWFPGFTGRVEMKALSRAARRGDAAAFRRALPALARADQRLGSSPPWLADPEVRDRLDQLDRHLYGTPTSSAPDLRALRRDLLAARRRSLALEPREGGSTSALATLDGPVQTASSPRSR